MSATGRPIGFLGRLRTTCRTSELVGDAELAELNICLRWASLRPTAEREDFRLLTRQMRTRITAYFSASS